MVELSSVLAAPVVPVAPSGTRLSTSGRRLPASGSGLPPPCTAWSLPESRGSTPGSNRPRGWSSPTAGKFDRVVARKPLARPWVAAVGAGIRRGSPWVSAVRGPGDAVRGPDREWRRREGRAFSPSAVGRTTKRGGPCTHGDGRHVSCCECPLTTSRSGGRNAHMTEHAARCRAHLTAHHARLRTQLRHAAVMRDQKLSGSCEHVIGPNRVGGKGRHVRARRPSLRPI